MRSVPKSHEQSRIDLVTDLYTKIYHLLLHELQDMDSVAFSRFLFPKGD